MFWLFFMQRRFAAGDLIPIDLEINAICRRRNTKRIRKFLQDLEAVATPGEEPQFSEASSSFPTQGQFLAFVLGFSRFPPSSFFLLSCFVCIIVLP